MEILIPDAPEEATAYGAAVSAGIGADVFKGYEATKELIKIKNKITPNKSNCKIYEKFYCFYQSLYPKFRGSFLQLYKLLQELG